MAHSATTLDALWKKTYADSLKDLIPKMAKLTKTYSFENGKKVGELLAA